jgi:hypothetical protein
MALTLDAIHAPLNDFFLKRFNAGNSAATQFRFDRFGSVVSDGDFMDPNRPENGYEPNFARQTFSEIVNHLPLDEGDGVSVALSAAAEFDDQYFYQILSPAMSCIPAGAAAADADSLTAAFAALKVEANDRWRGNVLESTRITRGTYEASAATPADWYDTSLTSIWNTVSFDISEPPLVPSRPLAPRGQSSLWRMKTDAVPASVAIQPALDVRTRIPAAAAVAPGRTPVRVAVPDITRAAMFDIGARMLQRREQTLLAATRPASTNSISVAFDYCVVAIKRPWMFDAFLRDTTWCIPGKHRGELTADRSRSLLLLTVAFVAIRNLVIRAHWDAADIEHAKEATDFGPFKVDSAIVDDKLSHSGIQIVGWLLEPLPVLPPNDAPAAG